MTLKPFSAISKAARRRNLWPLRTANPRPTPGWFHLVLCLALPLTALHATTAPTSPPGHFSEHRDARTGQLLFLRNAAAQPAATSLKTRAQAVRPATLPVFNRDELDSPAWSNDVATARQFLAQHGARFAENSRLTASPDPLEPRSRGRESAPSPAEDNQRRLTSAATGTIATPTFSPDTDLALLTAERDQLGMTHVRFQQTHRGLPVFGTEMTVHLDAAGRVSSAGGALAPDLAVDPTPTLTGEQAGLLAAALLQAQAGRPETPAVRATHLCILAPGLLRNDGDPTAWLVWEVRVVLQDCTTDCDPLADETFYLDAHTGTLREQMTGFRHLDRKVYDCAMYPGQTIACQIDNDWEFPSGTYYFGRSEGQPARGPCPQTKMNGVFLGSLDTDHLYDYLGLIHNYYLTNFNRDGGNARGGIGNGTDVPWTTTRGFVHTQGIYPLRTCPGGSGSSGTGFSWSGAVIFCRGMVFPDVVGHEYAHSVPFFSHYDTGGKPVGMVYKGESGALDENQADFFGEVFESVVSGWSDWILFPQSTFGADRNLADPPSYPETPNHAAPDLATVPHPDRYYASGFYSGTNDGGGLHHNATVPGKAAYLLAEGGRFNGCTIQSIGLNKVARIWYRAVTQYYGRTETFNGAYAKLIQSAVDLYGADSAEVRQTTRALQAVELDQPGACSGLPALPPAALDVEGW